MALLGGEERGLALLGGVAGDVHALGGGEAEAIVGEEVQEGQVLAVVDDVLLGEPVQLRPVPPVALPEEALVQCAHQRLQQLLVLRLPHPQLERVVPAAARTLLLVRPHPRRQ